MKKHRGLIFGLLAAVALLTAGFFFFGDFERDKYNWSERYKMDDKEPFDLSVIHTLLKERNPGKQFKEIKQDMGEELPKLDWKDTANYVLIGGSTYLDSASLENILSFVSQGNNAFLVSRYFPENLMYRIYDYSCNPIWEPYSMVLDSNVEFNFYHPDLYETQNYKARFFRRKSSEIYYWNCIDYSYFCGETDSTSQFISLGYLTRNDSNYINFFKVKYGSGTFYFHSNPILFTNYFMIRKPGYEYASKVFSHMSDGNVYWDERSKSWYSPKYSGDYQGQHDIMDSPLRYLLSQTSLRWALYTSLALVLLYAFLRARRRQRPIPLLEPNTNSSLDFVTSIGRLYYMQRNHQALCQQKARQFFAFLRNRYGFATNVMGTEEIARIAEKTGVNRTVLDEIIKQFKWIDTTVIELTDEELIRFHQNLDEFYKTCK